MQKHHQVSTQVLTLRTPALKSANTEKSLNESIGITVYVKKKNQTGQVPQKLSGKLGLPVPSLQQTSNKSDVSGQSCHRKTC